MTATPEQVHGAIDNYLKAWGEEDRKLLLSIFAEDATWEDPVGTPPFVGHEGVGKFWDFAHQQGNSLTPVKQQVIACGNQGILRFRMEVRTPDGKQGLNLHVVDRFVLNDEGRIQTAQAYWDESCAEQPEGLEMFIPNIDEMTER